MLECVLVLGLGVNSPNNTWFLFPEKKGRERRGGSSKEVTHTVNSPP